MSEKCCYFCGDVHPGGLCPRAMELQLVQRVMTAFGQSSAPSYDAVGHCNGMSDDTQAIQSAINAVMSGELRFADLGTGISMRPVMRWKAVIENDADQHRHQIWYITSHGTSQADAGTVTPEDVALLRVNGIQP